MNSIYKKLICINRHRIKNNFFLISYGKIKGNEFKIQKRDFFFFKNDKNDIIKNEIEEILKQEDYSVLTKHKKVTPSSQNVVEKKYGNDNNNNNKSKGKIKRLFIFIAFQSIPIIGLMYLFKYIEEVKLAELNYSFETSDDIINETIKLIEVNPKCYCLYSNNNEINTFFIDPLYPESSEINYEQGISNKESNTTILMKSDKKESEEIALTKDGFQDSEITEISKSSQHETEENKGSIESLIQSLNTSIVQKAMKVKSSTELPLNYLYFCISKNSDIHNFLKNNNNNISILYSDDKKNIYATLTGNATIIENENIKNIVWTNKWNYLIPGNYKDNYILIKFTPSIVSIKTIGLKNTHWKSNIVKRGLIDDKISWIKV
ncbi:conserved Plasmodium protein, unknown function [Plasmodium yoelii]|nr:conserved Plasmodium protein, unknown function [Plasmodium yoelii]EAA15638.1 hypothetical protein [Plasmodium yoelii yoelii]WBY61267.1 hypothetical protein Py17XNL_001401447 [Plasmodium yoelii yoelii]CDU20967.1 conserved Plasmodium protein, unknown function [Plasmodium yoelii]VTZ81933.1 conserved Plasmodium protein, unknown function [Plasmodium yoelii]|eukprot:XP_724073.1 conserved Plasmodium protein, unknown function [Plasmodium yoelii]